MAETLSARERLQACLDAIERWNPICNAMVAVDAAEAERQADAADAAARDGRSLGPLHGWPIAVKDNIDTAGLRTTCGSRFFADNVPRADAHVVARLREAGAVIVGKATLHEVAFGIRSTNPVTGQCRNPFDPARIPGGSSGGSGVAVATAMAEAALGTDTGGSVRVPAALNGITGLRPTVGRVSNAGCLPVSVTHDTIGPMARTVAEVAALFGVMEGYDPQDPISRHPPPGSWEGPGGRGVADLRIGLPRRFFFDDLDPEIGTALEAAIAVLEKAGARIVQIDLPGAEETHHWATTMIYADACHLHAERLADDKAALWGADTRGRMLMGLDVTGVQYAQAMRHREAWRRTLDGCFADVDLLVSPTTPALPPPIEEDRSLFEATRAMTRNTYAGAFGFLPGISVPCGISRGGLPIGMQLEADSWREDRLFRAAGAYQDMTEWHRLRPGAATKKDREETQ